MAPSKGHQVGKQPDETFHYCAGTD
jgi:hypothetical protein